MFNYLMCQCVIHSLSFIKILVIRISSNKFTTKLFFYCLLSLCLITIISIIMYKFINFYCKLVFMKTKINSIVKEAVLSLYIFIFKYFFYCFCYWSFFVIKCIIYIKLFLLNISILSALRIFTFFSHNHYI